MFELAPSLLFLGRLRLNKGPANFVGVVVWWCWPYKLVDPLPSEMQIKRDLDIAHILLEPKSIGSLPQFLDSFTFPTWPARSRLSVPYGIVFSSMTVATVPFRLFDGLVLAFGAVPDEGSQSYDHAELDYSIGK